MNLRQCEAVNPEGWQCIREVGHPGPHRVTEQAAGSAYVPSRQPNLADGLYEVEQLRGKLIVFRLVGLAVGIALWWLVVVQLTPHAIVLWAVALVVAAFGGVYAGTLVGLALLRR